uniref:Uncharacterized protein SEN0016 n=1 Tax=Synechococcus elongatus (strain ATCC 33912 / PCC 7942 / FACHB-805) TaxID=1140 RepID=Q8GJM3_SYNE7|nr:unknown protein [Synechococcus elongatus PCC 7942 = FACHB-805]
MTPEKLALTQYLFFEGVETRQQFAAAFSFEQVAVNKPSRVTQTNNFEGGFEQAELLLIARESLGTFKRMTVAIAKPRQLPVGDTAGRG